MCLKSHIQNPKVDENNTTQEINQPPAEQNIENQPNVENNEKPDVSSANNLTQSPENDNKEPENKNEHQVIHKKDGRLHIYVRQDKYKGELKSKNWVGRLYIDGKQKISSSGTTNLDDAIPILEKWFDDVQKESERLKNQPNDTQISDNQNVSSENISATEEKEKSQDAIETTEKTQTPIDDNLSQVQEKSTPVTSVENTEQSKQEQLKGKLSNIFGKLKDIKLNKPSFASKSSKKTFDKSKFGNLKLKFESFFKSKLGKSSVQGEEILGVELANKEIRLAQVSSNKANQWVLDKLYVHPVEITDDSSPIENADKFSEELSLAIQKYKISSPNVAISIPVTSAIIRVVTAPLMKEEELNKAIETNSLWENLVQLTDSLEDYSIFHQVISRNQKENTMDILFVASKLTDINSCLLYTSDAADE